MPKRACILVVPIPTGEAGKAGTGPGERRVRIAERARIVLFDLDAGGEPVAASNHDN